jgi:hypothetical protein
MLTLFTTPKPFKGHIAVTQRNALKSWTLLHPRPEILLFGDEDGAEQVAAELGLRHVPKVGRTQSGAPLLDDMFEKARQLATFDLLCYVNADIILLQDFMMALERVSRWRPRFLMIGERWDVDIREPWDFSGPEWPERLKTLALGSGKLRQPPWIDYFAFSKDLAVDLRPFAIGRGYWDNYLIWHARSLKAPVVDSSRVVLAIHQNHNYSHHPQGKEGAWRGEEATRNFAMVGGWWRHYSAADATHFISPSEIKPNLYRWVEKSKRVARRIYTPPWFAFLNLTRPLRHRLGLRKTVDPESLDAECEL